MLNLLDPKTLQLLSIAGRLLQASGPRPVKTGIGARVGEALVGTTGDARGINRDALLAERFRLLKEQAEAEAAARQSAQQLLGGPIQTVPVGPQQGMDTMRAILPGAGGILGGEQPLEALAPALLGMGDTRSALSLLQPSGTGFTLSPGQTRFGPAGAPVASVPPSGYTMSPGEVRFSGENRRLASVPKVEEPPEVASAERNLIAREVDKVMEAQIHPVTGLSSFAGPELARKAQAIKERAAVIFSRAKRGGSPMEPSQAVTLAAREFGIEIPGRPLPGSAPAAPTANPDNLDLLFR